MNEPAQPTRVLLIEDNAGDALLLRESLLADHQTEFVITHAESLAQARELLQSHPPDVILLDLFLPDSQGIATLRQVEAAASHLPIIVMTGLDREDVGIESVRLGAEDYLVKGKVSPDLLVRSIRYAIERNLAQQTIRRANDELERKVQERTAELRRLNQVLAMVSACNESMIRSVDEKTLLQDICRIAVAIGGYRMAWVGFVEDDPEKTVVPVAAEGFENGYLDNVKISWADDEHGRGPTGAAIRSAQVQIGKNFLIDPELAPWRQQALNRGYRSSIAMPLAYAEKMYGALTLYADQADAFDHQKIETLKPLAHNLAYGIWALRSQNALQQAQREVLEATEREQQRIGRDLHDSIQGNLAGIGFMLSAINKHLAGFPGVDKKVITDLDALSDVVKNTLNQVRGLVRGLCPLELKDDGLIRALKLLAATTSELFRVDCQFHGDMTIRADNETIAIQLYRIAQEAVNNALKHSRSKSIAVRLNRQDDALMLEVQDDGIGLPDNAIASGGLGLQAMNYRAKMISADLAVERVSPNGTLVRCRTAGGQATPESV